MKAVGTPSPFGSQVEPEDQATAPRPRHRPLPQEPQPGGMPPPGQPATPGTGKTPLDKRPHRLLIRASAHPSGPSLSCPQPSKLSLHILLQNHRNEIRKMSDDP